MKLRLVIGIAFIIVGLIWFGFEFSHQGLVWIPSCTGNGGRWGLPEYWDHTAPDGWYHVSGGTFNDGWVIFPLCPSCGSRLHGAWETTIYLDKDFDGDVRLENNVIVEVEK